MTEEKIKDIIYTLLEYNLMDYERAKYDTNYLIQCIESYIEALKLAHETLNMHII